MQIRFASIPVRDQDAALAFYTGTLGFEKMADITLGPVRWLTLKAPEGAAGVELVLEPPGFAPSAEHQRARFEAGMPATAFITADIDSEVARLKAKGVVFRGEPAGNGLIKAVLFEDTCGNLINLVQPLMPPPG